MKTTEEIQIAINEIRNVCKSHGIKLIGTCDSEGILGEITILDISNKGEPNWDLPLYMNEVSFFSGEFSVNGIGEAGI